MDLNIWVDENDNIYLKGKDNSHAAVTIGVQKTIDSLNAHLDEYDPDGDYKRILRIDIHRFRTLWVDPAAFECEEWDDDQWVDVRTEEADETYAAAGWIPVLSYKLAVSS